MLTCSLFQWKSCQRLTKVVLAYFMTPKLLGMACVLGSFMPTRSPSLSQPHNHQIPGFHFPYRNEGWPRPFPQSRLPFNGKKHLGHLTSGLWPAMTKWRHIPFPSPAISLLHASSDGPLLPWLHSIGWRCLEIMTTGGSREAEPEWWLASEEHSSGQWQQKQVFQERGRELAAISNQVT